MAVTLFLACFLIHIAFWVDARILDLILLVFCLSSREFHTFTCKESEVFCENVSACVSNRTFNLISS
jgi:hypothetical protein